jgi:hypothetical protein
MDRVPPFASNSKSGKMPEIVSAATAIVKDTSLFGNESRFDG